MIRVGIIGAASILGEVLIRHLSTHPSVTLQMLISETQKGKSVTELYPSLEHIYKGKFVDYDPSKLIETCDLVFIAKQHGEFLQQTAELIQSAGTKIKAIDLSADFRLKDPLLYPIWYNFSHPVPELLHSAVYGLSELYKSEIKSASLVANPGCYPTCIILGTAPLFSEHLALGEVIADAYSGVSGAGRRPSERNMGIDTEANIIPYKVGKHQHTPEIEQSLSLLADTPVKVVFIPHVAPFKYGILATICVRLNQSLNEDELISIYEEFYSDKPYIRIYKKGKFPQIRWVEGTNFCDIGVTVDSRTNVAIIISAIDNLLKGGAGQAIQNMNIMYDIPVGRVAKF